MAFFSQVNYSVKSIQEIEDKYKKANILLEDSMVIEQHNDTDEK